MAAVAGILFTDLFGLGDWWTAGAKPTGLPLSTLVGVEVAVFAFLEAKRYEAFKKNGPGLSGEKWGRGREGVEKARGRG